MNDFTKPNLENALQLLNHYLPTVIKERDEALASAEHYLKLQLDTRKNVGRYRKERDEARDAYDALRESLESKGYKVEPPPWEEKKCPSQ